MAGHKSLSSSWSYLRDSARLRGVLKYQMEYQDLYVTDVAGVLNIPADRIRKYLNGKKPSLTNYQIINLATNLGVEVSLDIKLIPTPTPL